MRDDDRMLNLTDAQFGSGIVGVCDICGERQAVVVLTKERFKLCVLDFLNKTWLKTDKKPGVPPPLYRSERATFETGVARADKAQAIVLSPTKKVKHPVVLITPDTFGITTTLLDAAIRFAREGFEVIIPDFAKTEGIGASSMLLARGGARFRGGVDTRSKDVLQLVRLCQDALDYVGGREMVDPGKSAVFGTSFGGSVALALAAQSTRLSAVALAYPLPVRPAGLPALVTAPLVCVAGTADRVASRSVAQLRAGVGPTAPTVVEIAGARHHFLARDLSVYDEAKAEEAWGRLIGFVRSRMMPAPPSPPPPPTKPADPLAAPKASPSTAAA